MKKVLLFLFLLVATAAENFAQVTTVPVDPLTGRLALTLPITALHSGSLDVPVVLVYTAGSGVQVNAAEGSAGVGWDLAVSGAVRRELRALPDDYKGTGNDARTGWLYGSTAVSIQNFKPTSDNDPTTCEDERDDFNFVNSLNDNIDPEPDLFSFSAPGLSGQFMFGADGVPQPIPYQDVKIVPIRDIGQQITRFEITTNAGVVYTFSVTETSSRQTTAAGSVVSYLASGYGYYQQVLNYTSGWNLSSIAAPDGSKVEYKYTASPDQVVDQNITAVVTEAGTFRNQYTTVDIVHRNELWYLQTKLNVLSFTWLDHRIQSVELEDQAANSLNIKYTFTYSEYTDKWAAGNLETRAFLTTVTQESNCSSYPSYAFHYKGLNETDKTVSLPFHSGARADLWGYCNGSSTTSIPELYVDAARTEGERMRVIPVGDEAVTLSGDGRAVSADYIASGMPTLIVYPTGSITYIQYEPNSYFDAAANKTQLGGGVRVKSVQFADTKTDYYYNTTGKANAADRTSGKLSYPPSYAFVDGTATLRTTVHLGPESYVLYSRAVVRQSGRGRTVYDYLLPGLYPGTTELDWRATRSSVVRFVPVVSNPCSSIGNLVNGFYTYPFARSTNFEFERGLPQYVRDYSETGAKVQERSYAYQRLTPGKVTIKGVRLERLANNIIVYGLYSVIANTGKVVQTETMTRADELNPGPDPANPVNVLSSTTTYGYGPTHQLLTSVKVVNSDGVDYTTNFRYAKDFTALTDPNINNPEAVGIQLLNATNRHGILLETQTLRAGMLTGASITLYKKYNDGRVLPSLTGGYPQGSGFKALAVEKDNTGKQVIAFADTYLSRVQSYSAVGHSMSVKDYRQKRSGVLYDEKGELPYAAVTNALAEEVAYEGFEDATPFFSVTGKIRTTDAAWAGAYGASMLATTKLVRENLSKGAKRYRVSCWVKAATATTITFRVYSNATTQATKALTYGASDVNTWKYLETIVDMSSASATFSLEVTTSAAANMDEVRFYPADATMSTYTYNILKGRTAEVGERGEAVFTQYDDLSRVTAVLDQNKDIRLLKEYNFASLIKDREQKIEGGFLPADGSQFYVGKPISFRAPDSQCLAVSYKWTFEMSHSTQSTTDQTLYYSPPEAGVLTATLTVSYPTLAPVTTQYTYCILAEPITFKVEVKDLVHTVPTDHQNKYYGEGCSENWKKFKVTDVSGGCGDYTYSWAITKGGVTTVLYTLGSEFTFDTMMDLKVTYQMSCTITSSCECAKVSKTVGQLITYHHTEPCE
jgi:hypothetical protein